MAIPPTNATQWAALALISFDTMLTFDQEIILVWRSPLTLHKSLYVLIRYLGLAYAIMKCTVSMTIWSPEFCAIMNIVTSTWLYLAAAAGDALLMLRVVALLKNTRTWRLALKCLYAVIYTVLLAMLCYTLSQAPIPPSDAVSYPNIGCTVIRPIHPSPNFADLVLPIATGPILLFNVLLLLIVLFKILPQYRSNADRNAPLLTLLRRDGAIYFTIMSTSITFVTVTPIALWHYPIMSGMSLSPFLAISPIAACRLYLHLRAGLKAAQPSSRTSRGLPSSMQFNIPEDESNIDPALYPTHDSGTEEIASIFNT